MADFTKEINEISALREQKGKEDETLNKIDELLPKAVESREDKMVIKLYWEAHLVWQHKYMSEIIKPKNDRDKKLLATCIDKMTEFAVKAKDVVESKGFTDMTTTAYRFLGRAASYSGDYLKAKEYYESAVKNCSTKNLKAIFEINGFLAEVLIRIGHPVEGFELGIRTFNDFNNSETGRNLKKEDYYTWAVWMSGIAPRVTKALIETSSDFDKEQAETWLKRTENELINPTGKVSWGDSNFEFRLEEIDLAVEMLGGLSEKGKNV